MGLLTVPEKIYDGATSLVDIIRKQFGDDIDGATQELVRQAGFPEPVARRIATGELPMDEASRVARRERQTYSTPVHRGKIDVYHGSNKDIKEFHPSEHDEYGFDTVDTTPDPDYASGYAENRYGRLDDNGVSTPAVYPLLIKGRASDESEVMGLLSALDEDAFYDMSPEEVAGYLQDNGIRSFNAFGGADEISVLDPTLIRSPNAAYDPQYTGSNIMGNATVPLLGATALGTAGLLTVPALMKDGVFQHGATSEPVAEKRKEVRNQSGLLEDVTDFGDEVFKSVRHAAGPVADVLMPYEGINNYLKTVNDYDKQPTWWDRLGILDF